MCFTYVLSGWEGSASDSYLWAKALEGGLKLPDGKVLLADAGFPFDSRLLIPFRGVRYHLKEFSSGTKRPSNANEIYNRRHAGARSVVERIFGVMKARFKILGSGSYFDIQVQAELFPALAVVHNIIRRLEPLDEVLDEALMPATGPPSDELAPLQHRSQTVRRIMATRASIARKMWRKYADGSRPT